MAEMKFKACFGFIEPEQFQAIEDIIGVKLPQSYKDVIKACDGGYPIKEDFEYFDTYFNQKVVSGIGCFLRLNDSPTLGFTHQFKHPPEDFPVGIIAFATTGGGDYICFDYRLDSAKLDPSIVYWNHEAESGEDVTFIAKDFEEFLGFLYEPEQ